ncbi:MAG: hypothetical protein H6621_11300 [Halobacteriovoraceae bacterium]|nr:hypothetical protein [Halobacteriovoraceae bacterium]MCB9095645.1 hypothetical protein [Halobacteriovoraceae bacterium]
MQNLISFLDIHNDDFLVIAFSFLTISFITFIFIWYYNKKKFGDYEHQIPAEVLKSYLDSIMQNSSALKSAPIEQMGSAAPKVDDSKLKGELDQKNNEISELKTKLEDSHTSLSSSEDKIKELEAKIDELAKKQGSGDGAGKADPALKAELESIKKEKEGLQERLQEYEIIEDDLANLKRLQQENEQLKKTLADLQNGAAPEPSQGIENNDPEPAPEPPVRGGSVGDEDVETLSAALDNDNDTTFISGSDSEDDNSSTVVSGDAGESDLNVSTNPSEAVEGKKPPEDDVNPDDLLSEFEKMLG